MKQQWQQILNTMAMNIADEVLRGSEYPYTNKKLIKMVSDYKKIWELAINDTEEPNID